MRKGSRYLSGDILPPSVAENRRDRCYHVTCKVCHKTVARRSRHMIYTIFRAGTNDVIVTGTAQQCAATLGIQVKSFWTTLANISAGRYHQYDYQREGYYDVE